jgi:ribonuclease D
MTLVSTNSELIAACAALGASDTIVVDTEFMRESTYWPQLCLIQAAADGVEVMIDPLAEGIDLAPFLALMNDESRLKVLHAPRQDMEIFFNLTGKPPSPIFDTQTAASALGYGDQIAYDALVQAVLGRPIDKGPRFTDWSRRPLSETQLVYALADVTHLRDLYPALRDKLEAAGRARWVDAEMAALADPALYDVTPDEAWRRLKLRKRDAKYLAALKAVAAWREREAQSRDVPRSRILKDDALYEIAQVQPRTVEALGRMRGIPKGFERSRGGMTLVEAMDAALADPAAYAPKVEKAKNLPNNIGPTVELLKVLLRQVAQQHGLAPRLLASVSDLEEIAASDNADVPALQGWRREVFGEEALKLKRGETVMTLKNGEVITRPA